MRARRYRNRPTGHVRVCPNNANKHTVQYSESVNNESCSRHATSEALGWLNKDDNCWRKCNVPTVYLQVSLVANFFWGGGIHPMRVCVCVCLCKCVARPLSSWSPELTPATNGQRTVCLHQKYCPQHRTHEEKCVFSIKIRQRVEGSTY